MISCAHASLLDKSLLQNQGWPKSAKNTQLQLILNKLQKMYPGLDYHENYVEEASCFMLGSKSNTGKPLHLPSPLASFRLCKDSNNSTSFLASCVFWHLSFFLSFSNKKVLRGILFYVSFIPCLGFSIEQEQNV